MVDQIDDHLVIIDELARDVNPRRASVAERVDHLTHRYVVGLMNLGGQVLKRARELHVSSPAGLLYGIELSCHIDGNEACIEPSSGLKLKDVLARIRRGGIAPRTPKVEIRETVSLEELGALKDTLERHLRYEEGGEHESIPGVDLSYTFNIVKQENPTQRVYWVTVVDSTIRNLDRGRMDLPRPLRSLGGNDVRMSQELRLREDSDPGAVVEVTGDEVRNLISYETTPAGSLLPLGYVPLLLLCAARETLDAEIGGASERTDDFARVLDSLDESREE